MLRRIGHRVHGSPIVDLRVFDASDDLAAFSRRNLQQYWARWIERTGPYFMQNGSRRDRAWAAGWCVLGVPRLYTAIAEGEIVSKTEAGVRARATFDSMWHALIDAALEHRRRNDEASTEAMSEVVADALPFAAHVLRAALALR